MTELFEKSVNGNIVSLNYKEKSIHLIGTAHVSQASVEEVTLFIKENKPDVVCIELCKARYETMRDKDRWKKMDVYKVIKEGKSFLLLTNLMISSFQYKIGKKLGVKPGAEMMAAIEAAESIGSEIVLIDRDVQITLKRTWRNMGFFKKLKLMYALLGGLILNEEISEKDIEKLKSSDTLSDAMASLGQEIPGLKETLIDERDRFMASHLTDLKGKKIVAVVGAGHVPGMQTYMDKAIDRAALEIIPPASKIFNMIKWLIPFIIVGIVAWFFRDSANVGYTVLFTFILARSIPAALGVVISGGKFISMVVAFFIAPITPIFPILKVSIVVGLTEAFFRKPKVEDLESIQDAFESIRAFYKNAITRILLVATLPSLLSNLSMWILFPYLVAYHKDYLESLFNSFLNLLS